MLNTRSRKKRSVLY